MDGSKIGLVLVLLLGVAGASAGYFVGKSAVVDGLIEASRRDDAKVFEDRIDWDVLRDNLKDVIAAEKKAMGAFGANIGPNADKIPAIVNHYIQPRHIPALFYYHDELFKGVKEEDFIAGSGFFPPYGFYVTIAYPATAPNAGGMAAAMRDRLKVRVIFGLSGLTWKIRNMHVPLFMVPTGVSAIPDYVLEKK